MRRHANLTDVSDNDTTVYENINHSLFWSENDFVQSTNEQSTVNVLLDKANLEKAQSIKYYDGHASIEKAKEVINNSTDEELINSCKAMADLSLDFKDDVLGWARHLNGNTFEQIGDFTSDPKVYRTVMDLCGNGYTKLYGLYLKTLSKPDLLFINQPMTSLHPHLGSHIILHLTKISPKTKFIITESNGFADIDSQWLEK